jgi:DNA-binding CsgD family transcriptional regulator/tetratricopeptide (TPR) repeat protein
MCTLGITRAWGDDPESGIALLEEARAIAESLGRADDLFRATANLTTALDLIGRRNEAVAVALAGIEAARRSGQEAADGNLLRGNGADSLFLLGRWDESLELSETALEWSPSGVQLLNALVTRALIEIERYADETAGRLLGRLLLEIETVPDEQESVPAYRAAASFALWRGDLVDAARTVELGWSRVRQTQDWFLVARMASTVLEVDAAIVADARQQRAVAPIAAARERAVRVLAEAEAVVRASGVAQSIGSRREADAMLGTARAYLARIEGRDEPAAWDALARGWEALERPYEVARSRWRQAEAALGTSLEAGEGRAGRATARGPLLEAVRIATELGARPLIRELSELAHRALIALPDETIAAASASGSLARRDGGGAVGHGPRSRSTPGSGRAAPPTTAPGPGSGGLAGSGLAREFVGPAPAPAGDTFGLTAREKEVLAQLAEGRTNREIGERLFISQKTVGVHVGNILAKLGVSGRVEAATVAVRLELTGRR